LECVSKCPLGYNLFKDECFEVKIIFDYWILYKRYVHKAIMEILKNVYYVLLNVRNATVQVYKIALNVLRIIIYKYHSALLNAIIHILMIKLIGIAP
jgi:hypothetical protein